MTTPPQHDDAKHSRRVNHLRRVAKLTKYEPVPTGLLFTATISGQRYANRHSIISEPLSYLHDRFASPRHAAPASRTSHLRSLRYCRHKSALNGGRTLPAGINHSYPTTDKTQQLVHLRHSFSTCPNLFANPSVRCRSSQPHSVKNLCRTRWHFRGKMVLAFEFRKS